MERITDHVARALAKLPQQFKGKANFAALLTVFCDAIQELEDGIWAVYDGTSLAGAIGDQLDVIGIRLGEARNGLTDDEYRVRLRIRIVRNFSKGEPERLIQVYKALTAAGSIQYTEAYPATFFINAKDAVGIDCGNEAGIITAMEELRAGGVTGVYSRSRTGAFKFAGSKSGGGFGDATDPAVGGGLAYLLRTVCPVAVAIFQALFTPDTNPGLPVPVVGAWSYVLDDLNTVSGDASLLGGGGAGQGAAIGAVLAAGDMHFETIVGATPANGGLDSTQILFCFDVATNNWYSVVLTSGGVAIVKATAGIGANLGTAAVVFAPNDILTFDYVYATGVITVSKNGVLAVTGTADTAYRNNLGLALYFVGTTGSLRTSLTVTRP